MSSWHRHNGDWWMVQWAVDGWLSFGIHLEFRHRTRGDGLTYGPYVDVHLGVVILSFGWHPLYAGDLDLHKSTAISRELG